MANFTNVEKELKCADVSPKQTLNFGIDYTGYLSRGKTAILATLKTKSLYTESLNEYKAGGPYGVTMNLKAYLDENTDKTLDMFFRNVELVGRTKTGRGVYYADCNIGRRNGLGTLSVRSVEHDCDVKGYFVYGKSGVNQPNRNYCKENRHFAKFSDEDIRQLNTGKKDLDVEVLGLNKTTFKTGVAPFTDEIVTKYEVDTRLVAV